MKGHFFTIFFVIKYKIGDKNNLKVCKNKCAGYSCAGYNKLNEK